MKVIQNRTSYSPHLTKEIKELMNLRDTAKSEAAKTGSVEEYEEYKRLRNIVSTKQKSAEGEYYKSKYSDPEASTGDLWRNTYQLLGKTRSTFPCQILVAGKLISKPIVIGH